MGSWVESSLLRSQETTPLGQRNPISPIRCAWLSCCTDTCGEFTRFYHSDSLVSHHAKQPHTRKPQLQTTLHQASCVVQRSILTGLSIIYIVSSCQIMRLFGRKKNKGYVMERRKAFDYRRFSGFLQVAIEFHRNLPGIADHRAQ